jgi:hypothetical protein
LNDQSGLRREFVGFNWCYSAPGQTIAAMTPPNKLSGVDAKLTTGKLGPIHATFDGPPLSPAAAKADWELDIVEAWTAMEQLLWRRLEIEPRNAFVEWHLREALHHLNKAYVVGL